MRVIRLAGDHRTMGRQHGYQVRDLRPHILAAMHKRLASMAERSADPEPYVAELISVWEVVTPAILEMLRGMAEALELTWNELLRYAVAAYLEDHVLGAGHTLGQGCTVWAAAAPITHGSIPLLVKNRDYRPDHQPLQCLAQARPVQGYRYTYVTSAGSPGVFSSGMNEVGLAVADTRVTSLDIGPGVARYSAMMELLEHHASVASALDYLGQVPHIGDGTLVLIDQADDMAVFEAGYSVHGIVRPQEGFVVSTNHFVTDSLSGQWVDRSPPALRGNSECRHARVTHALLADRGQVDTALARRLMACHGDPQEAICRHSELDPRMTTISSALYLPRAGKLLFADGRPCQAAFCAWSVG